MQGNFFILMLQSVAALALVLAIFAGMVWGLRRLQFRQLPKGEAAMRVVQRLAIDTRHSVVEVDHHGRRYLLGVSPSGMTTIASSESQKSDLSENSVEDSEGVSDVAEV